MSAQNRYGKYYKFGVYLLVVVLVNIAGITLFLRSDLTSNGIYSLSDASVRAVSKLKEPLTINVFFTKNLPAPYNSTERYLRDVLEEYAVHSNKYFNYRFYDVSAEEGNIDEEAKRNQEMARNYGIYPIQIQNIERDEVKFQNAYMGLVMIQGDVVERIPTITTTENIEYQITSNIEKMNNKISTLLGMTEPVQLKLVFSSSLETIAPQLRMEDLMQMPGKIKEMVGKLNGKYYDKLQVTVLDPTADPSLQDVADKYNVLTLTWPSFKDRTGQEVVPAGKASAGLIVEHGENFQTIPLIRIINVPLFGTQYQMANLDDMEKKLEAVIDDVIDINKKIGYLTSHGTLPLQGMPSMPGAAPQQDNLGNFYSLVSNDYSIVNVDLKKEDTIPEGIDCLIIAGPKEEFNDYELFQIDQFLMKGKSLALFLDPYEEVQMPQGQQMQQFGRQPMYRPIDTGMEKLIEHYGLSLDKAYVLDTSCYEQKLPQAYGGGQRSLYFAPIIKSDKIIKDVSFMNNIKGLVMLLVAPVKLKSDVLSADGLKGEVLFSSSDHSWLMRGRIDLNEWAMHPPQKPEDMSSYPLAALVQGDFPSYFADRGIPEKPAPEEGEGANPQEGDTGTGATNPGAAMAAPAGAGTPPDELKNLTQVGAVLKRGRPGKVFLLGTAEVLKNTVIGEGGNSVNANFIMNVIDNLNARDDYAQMRSKTQQFNPLKETGPGWKAFVKMFNIIGLPLLVAVFGIIVWMRRSARKRMIQTMFGK